MNHLNLSTIFSNSFQQATDALSSLISIKNLDLKYIYANQHSLNYLGFNSLKEITDVAPSDYEIRCPAHICAEDFINEDKQVLTSGTPSQILALCNDAMGNKVLMLGTKKCWLDENNNVQGIICDYQTIVNSDFINTVKIIQELGFRFIKNKKQFSYVITNQSKTYFDLTRREEECFFYAIRGLSSKAIARRLNISYRTVEIYLANLKIKFNCKSKQDLIDMAFEHGLYSYIPSSIL